MQAITKVPSVKQELFREMVLGILVYTVVLGFFEEYTDILSTWSYPVTFLVAVVMQILTYVTILLKSLVVKHFRAKEGRKYQAILVFGVWMILFFSKFVFLAVIDFIFSNAVELSGFVGLMLVIVTMTITKKLIELVYSKLA